MVEETVTGAVDVVDVFGSRLVVPAAEWCVVVT